MNLKYFSPSTTVFTSLWAYFSHHGLRLSNPTVSEQCLARRGPAPNADGGWLVCSISGESVRLDVAQASGSTQACVPGVVEVEAENYIHMWSADPVLRTVIRGDRGLQKHFSKKNLWLLTMTPSFPILKRKYLLFVGLSVAKRPGKAQKRSYFWQILKTK